MKERPILFSAPMVRAILAGQKTQTRRIVKPQPHADRAIYNCEGADTTCKVYSAGLAHREGGPVCSAFGFVWKMTKLGNLPCEHQDGTYAEWLCPYGKPGDQLWVKETWAAPITCEKLKPTEIQDGTPLYFRADNPKDWERQSNRGIIGKWRPSIFMRRWMSRITLEIAAVRVERLQDISEADALAEGMDVFEDGAGFTVRPGGTWQRNPEDAFRNLWDSINGPDSWATNLWVWAIEFRRVV